MNFKRFLGLLIVLCLFLIHSGIANAAGGDGTSAYDTIQKHTTVSKDKKAPSQTEGQTLPKSSAGGTFLTFLKLIFALGVVLALILFLYRFLAKRTRAFQSVGQLRNLGGVAVGPNRSVQLVKIGDEILVVGVGENVQLIKTVEDQELLKKLQEAESQKSDIKGAQLGTKLLQWAKETGQAKPTRKQQGSYKNQLFQVLKERSEELHRIVKKEKEDE
ncbi:MAG TPA: flagellar biosynthetic protein FliO [Candidatus Angelobacter sp.]|nr:flagellar biosynthetic protein FliO [Candidatus Angelobacter sp.]